MMIENTAILCPWCDRLISARAHQCSGLLGQLVTEGKILAYWRAEKMEKQTQEEKRIFPSGTTSTRKPRFELLPKEGLIRAARRFELGLEMHGDRSWNALSNNQSALEDKEWLIERCSHGIQHLYNLIDKLSGKTPLGGDDDAAAVAWCGLVLAAAMEKLENGMDKVK
jgi:hypothetical protein